MDWGKKSDLSKRNVPAGSASAAMRISPEDLAKVVSAAASLHLTGRRKPTPKQELAIAAALALRSGRWSHCPESLRVGLAVAAYCTPSMSIAHKQVSHYASELRKLCQPYQDCMDALSELLSTRPGPGRSERPIAAPLHHLQRNMSTHSSRSISLLCSVAAPSTICMFKAPLLLSSPLLSTALLLSSAPLLLSSSPPHHLSPSPPLLLYSSALLCSSTPPLLLSASHGGLFKGAINRAKTRGL